MTSFSPSRILAIKLADIGDLLLVTPALRALRSAFPQAQLDLLVTPGSAVALEGADLYHRLLFFDKAPFDHPRDALRVGSWGDLLRLARELRAGRYDTVILFHHLSLRFGALKHAALLLATGAPRRVGLDNGRGRFLTHRRPDPGFGVQHELDYWLDLAALVGAPAVSRQPEIALAGPDRDIAGSWLPPGDRPTVALHPGSGGYSLARRWEPAKFARLGLRLRQELNARLVLVGTPADGTAELAAQLGPELVDLGGRTSLTQLAAVLERCDLLIGADSGVLHVASAVGTPTVALFGPTNHRAWAPALPPGRLTVIRSGSACSPCAYTRRGLGCPDGCPQRTCMAMISVDRVLKAAKRSLAGRAPEPDSARERPRTWLQPEPRQVPILGVPLHALTFDQLLDSIQLLIDSGRPHQIATVNPEFVMAARRDPIFCLVLERASLCLADGVGLLWAARWLNLRGRRGLLPQRVTGSDGLPLIAERAARQGWRLFLLGGADGVAEQTAAILTGRYPGLQIVGTHAGSPAAEEEASIVQRVNQSQADILFVAYGAPKQDKWIARNLPRLQVGVAMGVGGALDFVCGKATRAPRWMRRVGLEWLYRLWREPWRWRRMLALPRFALAVFWAGLGQPERVDQES